MDVAQREPAQPRKPGQLRQWAGAGVRQRREDHDSSGLWRQGRSHGLLPSPDVCRHGMACVWWRREKCIAPRRTAAGAAAAASAGAVGRKFASARLGRWTRRLLINTSMHDPSRPCNESAMLTERERRVPALADAPQARLGIGQALWVARKSCYVLQHPGRQPLPLGVLHPGRQSGCRACTTIEKATRSQYGCVRGYAAARVAQQAQRLAAARRVASERATSAPSEL